MRETALVSANFCPPLPPRPVSVESARPESAPEGGSPAEVQGVATPTGSFWHVLREALHGSRRDYTEGPVGSAILLLAIPMVLEMVLESVFAVTDVFFVSRLGESAIATVGLT